jgi:hypothetical protein
MELRLITQMESRRIGVADTPDRLTAAARLRDALPVQCPRSPITCPSRFSTTVSTLSVSYGVSTNQLMDSTGALRAVQLFGLDRKDYCK